MIEDVQIHKISCEAMAVPLNSGLSIRVFDNSDMYC